MISKSRWVTISKTEFSSMKTMVGFEITKGVVATAPVWAWIAFTAFLSFMLGVIV